MAIHSGILAWRIPWTEDPGGTLCSVAKSQTGLKQLASVVKVWSPHHWTARGFPQSTCFDAKKKGERRGTPLAS